MGGVLAAGVLLALVSLVPVVEAVTSAGAPAASVARCSMNRRMRDAASRVSSTVETSAMRT